jgi:hypothetical protein
MYPGDTWLYDELIDSSLAIEKYENDFKSLKGPLLHTNSEFSN